MATITIFGATGRTGRLLCRYAREAGHEGRALVRTVSKLGPEHDAVHVTPGDATNPRAVADALAGATIAISALGDDNFRAPVGTLPAAMAAIAGAGRATGLQRVLSVAGGGILDADDGSGQRRANPRYPEVFRAISAQHDAAWRTLVDSGLEWTVACTPDIVPGERTGTYRLLVNHMPPGGKQISCEDLAGFLVEEATERRYVNQRVGLAY